MELHTISGQCVFHVKIQSLIVFYLILIYRLDRHLLEFIAAAVSVDCATVVDGKPSILLSDSCTAGALINVKMVVMIAS